jgi:hypothetical protein
VRGNPFLQALALATQLGFAIACPMLVFIGGGAWLDGVLHTSPWLMLLGVLLGILSAAGALYQLTTIQTRRRTPPPTRTGTGTSIAPYKVEPDRQDDLPTERGRFTGMNPAARHRTRRRR